jgi:hypothetical protein
LAGATLAGALMLLAAGCARRQTELVPTPGAGAVVVLGTALTGAEESVRSPLEMLGAGDGAVILGEEDCAGDAAATAASAHAVMVGHPCVWETARDGLLAAHGAGVPIISVGEETRLLSPGTTGFPPVEVLAGPDPGVLMGELVSRSRSERPRVAVVASPRGGVQVDPARGRLTALGEGPLWVLDTSSAEAGRDGLLLNARLSRLHPGDVFSYTGRPGLAFAAGRVVHETSRTRGLTGDASPWIGSRFDEMLDALGDSNAGVEFRGVDGGFEVVLSRDQLTNLFRDADREPGDPGARITIWAARLDRRPTGGTR